MNRTARVRTVAVALVLAITPAIAVATPDLVAKAKTAGYPAQSCNYCHGAALPKKETFKPETDLNERGKWLVAEKTKRNAKEVSVDWLKDYKGK